MYRSASIICLALALLASSIIPQNDIITGGSAPAPTADPALARGAFSPNIGQFGDDGILFAGQGCQFTAEGFSVLSRSEEDPSTVRVVSHSFIGNDRVTPVGSDPAPWTSNYLLGNDPARWRTEVPVYREIVYPDLWDGIDLSIGYDGKELSYQVFSRPGSDISSFGMMVDDGTAEHTLRDMSGSYAIASFSSVSPVRSESDPLIAAAYQGGHDIESGSGIDVAPDGTLVIVGQTSSADFPTTAGAYGKDYWGGFFDVFVSKFNRWCQPLWATYIGGSDRDIGYSIDVGGDGSIYIAGYTDSYNFPTTIGAFDRIYNTTTDAFVLKLNPGGDKLGYSTYLGGTGEDLSSDICEVGGTVFVTGQTWSVDFPTTADALNDVPVSTDCYIAKLSFSGGILQYSTLLGGNGLDGGFGIEVDGDGNIVVMGETKSTDLPITKGAYDDDFDGVKDVFIAKVNSSTKDLDYCTYLGGEKNDYGNGLALDDVGNAYVTGATESVTFPSTPRAYNTHKNDYWDVFVTKLNASGDELEYSTFVGDDQTEYGVAIDVDAEGHAYVTGFTNSPFFPSTKHAYDTSFSEGVSDAVVFELSADGERMVYSSFLGGSGQDYGYGIVIQGPHRVYVTGQTSSDDFPTNPADTYNGGNFDVMIAGMNVSSVPFAPRNLLATASEGKVTLKWDPPKEDGGPDIGSYRIYRATSKTWGGYHDETTIAQYVDIGLDNGRTYYYQVSAVNDVGESARTSQAGAMPATFPGPVRNLTAERGDKSVMLSWRAPADDGGYAIVRYSVEKGMNNQTALFKNVTSTQLEDQDVSNGIRYWYRISAVNWLGKGPQLTISAVPATLPSVPQGLTFTEGDSKIVLLWKEPVRDGGYPMTGYRIYRQDGEGAFAIIANGTTSLNYTDGTVKNGGVYAYMVSAFNLLGEGGRAGSHQAYPSGPPAKVAGLVVDSGLNWAQLTWRTPDNGGSPIKGYKVYRGRGPDSMELVTTTSTPDHKDTGLQKGRTYYYAVTAFNRMGEGNASDKLSTTPSTVPATPVNLQVAWTKVQTQLTWTAPENGGMPITGYRIFKGPVKGDLTYLATAPKESFIDRDVTPGSTYRYEILAVNARGEGPRTDDVIARIPDEDYEEKEQSTLPVQTYFLIGGIIFAIVIALTIVIVFALSIRNRIKRRNRWK
jgi:fibronectin type 3 domain-containing protein